MSRRARHRSSGRTCWGPNGGPYLLRAHRRRVGRTRWRARWSLGVEIAREVLEPVSQATVTTVLPAPSSTARRIAPATFSPVEVPASRPSSAASRRAIARPSASSIDRTSSYRSGSRRGGMNPMPVPSTPCVPGSPPEMTAVVAGSKMTIRVSAPALANALDTPITRPAVPTMAQNTSIGPSICPRSSLPIPR